MKRIALLVALALAVPSVACTAETDAPDVAAEDDLTAKSDSAAEAAFTKTTKDVYFLSESDHALVWVKSAKKLDGYLTASDVKAQFAAVTDGDAMADKPLAGLYAETVAFETFAGRYKPVAGEDADNFAYHQQMTKVLSAVRNNLKNPKVIRLGRKSGNALVGAISVYIVGTLPSGKIGGIFTVSVET